MCPPPRLNRVNPIQAAFVWSSGTRGWGEADSANETYKADCASKNVFFEVSTWADDGIWRKNYVTFSNAAIFNFFIFSNPPKNTKIDQKIVKINNRTPKWSKNVKSCVRKEENLKIRKNRLWKSGCHDNVILDKQGVDIPNCIPTSARTFEARTYFHPGHPKPKTLINEGCVPE